MIPHLFPVFFGSGASVVAVQAGRREARSGIFLSGVTHAGMSYDRFMVIINGVDCTRFIRMEDVPTVTETLEGAPPTFAFSVRGMTPTLGNDVKVLNAYPNDYIFGGTITKRQPFIFGTDASKYHWHCVATGYSAWLMDKTALVTRRYASQGINGILADILANYTQGGFRVGYAPMTLGNAPMDFQLESVLACCERLARAAEDDAYFEVTADKVVNLYNTYPAAYLPTFSESSVDLASIEYVESLDEIRTRAMCRGAGSTCTALSGVGSTTVAVQDTGAFSAFGGDAISGFSLFTYDGKTPASGPGVLTGVLGLDYDIQEGDEVRVIATAVDLDKQDALASAVGGGDSGVAMHLIDEPSATPTEVVRIADADVEQNGTADKTLSFRYADTPRWMHVGRLFTASMTKPLTVSGEFRVQVLTTQVFGRGRRQPNQAFNSPAVTIRRQVSASKTIRTLAQVLRKVA